MTEYKTLRVPEPAYDLAKQAKQDGETWGEYLRRCSENPPEAREFVEVDPGAFITPKDISEAFRDHDGCGPVQLEATEYQAIARAVRDELQ